MKKYWKILSTGLQNDLAYRVNFIMWRVRQVIQFLIPFFIWTAVVNQGEIFYGYTLAKLLTYVFLSRLVLGALVFGSRTIDLAGIINSGDLTLYLLKPISIFKYWFTRDISDKLINLSFILFELPLLILIFKPPIFIQTNWTLILQSILAITVAVVMYFYLNFLFGMIGFWSRSVWAPRFLLLVILEFAAGGLFPLDMLPDSFHLFLKFTPFPYMMFFPLSIYLGTVSNYWPQLLIAISWTFILRYIVKYVWKKGLLRYDAEGR